MSVEVQAINRVREHGAQARRWPGGVRLRGSSGAVSKPQQEGPRPSHVQAFRHGREAIRFAVEDVPPPALLGAYLEVDEARFGLHEIQYLYERAAYPLKRRAIALVATEAAELS